MKISADGMFARLDELQLQKAIRLSELPLPGKIRGVYQSIGRKPKLQKHLVVSVQGLRVMKGAQEGKRRQG